MRVTLCVPSIPGPENLAPGRFCYVYAISAGLLAGSRDGSFVLSQVIKPAGKSPV